MGPPSYMRSVVDRNVVMRPIPVFAVRPTSVAEDFNNRFGRPQDLSETLGRHSAARQSDKRHVTTDAACAAAVFK